MKTAWCSSISGHTAQFKLYMVENNAVQESRLLPTGASGHGALASLLQAAASIRLSAAASARGRKRRSQNAGLPSTPALPGNADQSVQALLSGTLHFVPDIQCSHHHENGHTCGEDKHGCGGKPLSGAQAENVLPAFRVSSVLAENQRVGTIETPRRGETAHVS